jgi:anti-sigma B factor antagonist
MQVGSRSSPERVTVLAPTGRLDHVSAPALQERVKRLVEAGDLHIVLDLDGVSFVDSTGLGALVAGLKRARQEGGDLRIARPNQQVRLLLEMTSLNRVLRPYEAVEEASRYAGPELSVLVSCDATAEHLGVVHEALARFWRRMGAPPSPDWRLRFELAVSEVAANIIEHARPQLMYLRLSRDQGRVVAEFTDAGRELTSADRPGLAALAGDLAERGRGLALSRAVVDEMRYERMGLTNRWRLVKRI